MNMMKNYKRLTKNVKITTNMIISMIILVALFLLLGVYWWYKQNTIIEGRRGGGGRSRSSSSSRSRGGGGGSGSSGGSSSGGSGYIDYEAINRRNREIEIENTRRKNEYEEIKKYNIKLVDDENEKNTAKCKQYCNCSMFNQKIEGKTTIQYSCILAGKDNINSDLCKKHCKCDMNTARNRCNTGLLNPYSGGSGDSVEDKRTQNEKENEPERINEETRIKNEQTQIKNQEIRLQYKKQLEENKKQEEENKKIREQNEINKVKANERNKEKCKKFCKCRIFNQKIEGKSTLQHSCIPVGFEKGYNAICKSTCKCVQDTDQNTCSMELLNPHQPTPTTL